MTGMEARLRKLEDRAALEDLVVRYFVAVDSDDYETLRAIFAKNSSFSASGFSGGSNREEVISFLATDRKKMGLTVHTPDFTLLDIQDETHATGMVGAHLELVRNSQALYGAVRYKDRYLREDNCWRILDREMETIFIGPWGEIANCFADSRPVRWPNSAPQQSTIMT